MSTAIEIVKKTFTMEKIVEAFNNEKKIQQEMAFAIQALDANSFLATTAENNKASLMKAIINIALTGITLNPVLKLAYLVPRDKQVCLDFSYRGLLKIVYDAKVVKSINCQIIHENDLVSIELGTNQKINHSPALQNRGKIIGCYSVATLFDDTNHIEIMNHEDIQKIKSTSKAKSGPWQNWEEEMIRKSVIKRQFKYLPVPENVLIAVQADNEANHELKNEALELQTEIDIFE